MAARTKRTTARKSFISSDQRKNFDPFTQTDREAGLDDRERKFFSF
jgi:hypothetical protein